MAYPPPPPGYIDLGTYAARTGRNEGNLRRLAGRGRLEGARKVGGRWVVPDPDYTERLVPRGFCLDGTEWWLAATQPEPSEPWLRFGDKDLGPVASAYGIDPDHGQDYRWFVGFQLPRPAKGPRPTASYRYLISPNVVGPGINEGPEGCEDLTGLGVELNTNSHSAPNVVCTALCDYGPEEVTKQADRRAARKAKAKPKSRRRKRGGKAQ